MNRDIAELFLINFTKSLIEIKAPLITQLKSQEINDSSMQMSILKSENIPKIEKNEISKFNILPFSKVQQIDIPKNQKHNIQYQSQSKISATDKLNSLIKDHYVNEIECVGVNSPLIVKKSGLTQNTQINLSIDEIYEIIAEFSQKTRIPVINGRIKAALNDLIITAVLSETLGPRFIIQKMKGIII